MSAREQFLEEEELRLGLEKLGRVHDCVEAGCELNPEGASIPDGAKPKRRPKPSRKLRSLWKKYRQGEL